MKFLKFYSTLIELIMNSRQFNQVLVILNYRNTIFTFRGFWSSSNKLHYVKEGQRIKQQITCYFLFQSIWTHLIPFSIETVCVHVYCRPDLLDWRQVERRDVRERIDLAFHIMDREYGVTRLLDPEGESFYIIYRVKIIYYIMIYIWQQTNNFLLRNRKRTSCLFLVSK